MGGGLLPGVGDRMTGLAPLKVGFTGTRHGMSRAQCGAVADLLFVELAPVCELHHGDCVGADADADLIAHAQGIATVVHPPYLPAYRAWSKNAAEYRPPKDYLSRDVDIVDETDVLIAAPYRETERGGTWFTVRYARQQNRPLAIVYRSGFVTWERLGNVR